MSDFIIIYFIKITLFFNLIPFLVNYLDQMKVSEEMIESEAARAYLARDCNYNFLL
jgi:hypothetical protein